MAGLPTQRAILNPLEKPYSSDLNYQATESDASLRDSLRLLCASRVGPGPAQDGLSNPQGFFGDSFKARPTGSPSMAVVVTAGTGLQDSPATPQTAIGGIIGVNDTERAKWLFLSAPVTFTVPGNSSGSARVDLIEVAYRQGTQALADNQNRPILNPTTGVFVPTGVYTTLSPDLANSTGTGTGAASANLYYKVGNPGSGAPATDAGYVVVGYVLVPNGATSVGLSGLIDRRVILSPSGTVVVSGTASVETATNQVAQITSLQAPPGVVVGIIGNDQTSVNLFIVAGNSAPVSVPNIQVTNLSMDGVYLGTPTATLSPSAFAAPFVMTSPVAAKLVDSAYCAPASQATVAVGQPCLSCGIFNLTPVTSGPTSTFNFIVTMQF